jgi:uncharacterized tellurite resistance protein B-like protein
MTPVENLYYAIGQIAYAVAICDGKVESSERKKFHDIVEEELKKNHYSFDISSIIFQVLDRDHMSAADSYSWAMKQIRLNSHYLSPELKSTFIKVIEKIALAFPPVTEEEKKLIADFKKDIRLLNGDPAYYL